MARFQVEGRYEQVNEVIGKLAQQENTWLVGTTEFSVDSKKNPWVVSNMKKFMYEGRTVVCKVSENVLLSVRIK